jgi:isopropylmalate/homocitrate/citramalate synthase
MEQKKIEIMDTTLRDGEQTSGVSFSAAEKLTIAQLLLEELHIDRIEIYKNNTSSPAKRTRNSCMTPQKLNSEKLKKAEKTKSFKATSKKNSIA